MRKVILSLAVLVIISGCASNRELIIHRAADNGDLAALNVILDENPKLLNARDEGGRTPLHRAVGKNQMEAVKYLLARGAQVNVQDRIKDTPLSYASGNTAIARLLLEHGADPNLKNFFGAPLNGAATACRIDLARLLLSYGADVNVTDYEMRTPLHCVLYFFDPYEEPISDEARHPYDHSASYDDRIALAKLLIANGADLNARDQWGYSPLFYAVWGPKNDFIEFLLSSGGDLNAVDEHGSTLLHAAAEMGRRVPHPERAPTFCPPPERRRLGVAELLLAKGIDINIRNKDGETPLHTAVADGELKMAEFLIGKGADIDAKDNNGRNVMHTLVCNLVSYSSSYRYGIGGRLAYSLADLILSSGVDINARDKKGRTPLDLAVKEKREWFAAYLRERGAKTGKELK